MSQTEWIKYSCSEGLQTYWDARVEHSRVERSGYIYFFVYRPSFSHEQVLPPRLSNQVSMTTTKTNRRDANDDDDDKTTMATTRRRLRQQRRQRWQRRQDSDVNNDSDNGDTATIITTTRTTGLRRQQWQRQQRRRGAEIPTKLSPSHHAMIFAPLRGRGRMLFTAVYPQNAPRPCKNAVMARKRGNDTVGNGNPRRKLYYVLKNWHSILLPKRNACGALGLIRSLENSKVWWSNCIHWKIGWKARHNLCWRRVWPVDFREKEEDEISYSSNGEICYIWSEPPLTSTSTSNSSCGHFSSSPTTNLYYLQRCWPIHSWSTHSTHSRPIRSWSIHPKYPRTIHYWSIHSKYSRPIRSWSIHSKHSRPIHSWSIHSKNFRPIHSLSIRPKYSRPNHSWFTHSKHFRTIHSWSIRPKYLFKCSWCHMRRGQ